MRGTSRFKSLANTMALGMLLATLGPASAGVLEWQNPAAGDWFDGGNWNASGAAPSEADTAIIANGGTVLASAGTSVLADTLLVGGGDASLGLDQSGHIQSDAPVQVSALTAVGRALTGVASASGSLSTNDGLSSGLLQVGVASRGSTDSAAGSVHVSSGDVTGVTGPLDIGVAVGDGTQAQGSLFVDDGAVNGAFGALTIGAASGTSASARGMVKARAIASNSSGFGSIMVGRDSGGGGAQGTIITDSLSLAAPVANLEVGHVYSAIGSASGGNSAHGEVRVGSGNIDTHALGTLIGVDNGVAGGNGDVRGLLELGGTLSNSNAGSSFLRIGSQGEQRSGMVAGELTVQELSGYAYQYVGVSAGDAGNTTGTLTVGSGGMNGGALVVGVANGGADVTGKVVVIDGNLTLSGSLNAGRVGPGATGNAEGSLAVSNSRLSAGVVTIANNGGTGTAIGMLDLTAVTAELAALRVGASSGSSGAARGVVTFTDSIIAIDQDLQLASGDGVGQLSLNGSLVDVANALVLGAEARLHINVNGALRGTDYGALDVGSAALDGMLEIAFGSATLLDGAFFDLVVSDALDGLRGGFASVRFYDLTPDLYAHTAFVVDTVGGREVEIYRLYVETVPEPSTLALLGGGVVGLRYRGRKRLKAYDSH